MNSERKLIDLIEDFDNAMLTTRSDDGSLESRPMVVAEISEEGVLWFVTDRNSGKVADLILDQAVAVTFQGKRVFASLSGQCEVVDDRSKIADLWRESWKIWFPQGKLDADITLLKVVPSHGEYWDNSGTEGLRYLVKAGAAYLQGERASTDAGINAAVDF